MSRFAGCCRFVWNKALAVQKERLDRGDGCLSYNQLAAELVGWKSEPETAFLAEAHSQILQQSLRHLDQALRDAFDKTNPKRFPKFKKKGQYDRFHYPQGFKVEDANHRVFLPKLGWVGYRPGKKCRGKRRNIIGVLKNVTVSCDAGKWYMSAQTEREIERPAHSVSTIVGIDLGVAKFATLSDGTVFESVNSYRQHEVKLAHYQRALARKQKFGGNWGKQKTRIAHLHTKIARIRQDRIHWVTGRISKNHAVVVIEDLPVKAMSASAQGTIDQPGRNVRAKSGLNRSILDQGWAEFRRQLKYKQAWRGGEVLAVPPAFTSQRCSCCGHVHAANRVSQAMFHCRVCGPMINADLNAARNILAAGHAVMACEANGAVMPSAAGTHRSEVQACTAP